MVQAVEAVELTRRFGDFVAVDRVSFTVARGEVFGFLGPNGAGKTTTIKMLTGLLAPSSGTARVAGHDVVTDPRSVRQQLGYMSQLFSLYSDLTVEENIRLFAGLYGVTGKRYRERRDWVLEMAGLQEYRDRLTGELALGHKQRLALGCAVLHQPPILFLDEPTSGVDPISRRSFWELIYQLAREGTTVLVSTHYMDEAEYCYRLALMHRGRLIALDRPGALRRRVTVPILEVEVDDAARAVEVLAGVPGVLEAAMFGRRVHAMVEEESSGRKEVAERLAGAGLSVSAIRPVAPSLEDVFVALVRRSSGEGSW
ncbi:MAG: ABC transporter ATP-binding protein [Gemmatimonadales bacterium]|nr:putative ABC transporter ATP-binding protein YbhF [bacterium HR33]GIW52342.1 MAG: ABC transporter ATP-binding protein [Gemmatimonadales bacterium]